MTGLSTYTSDSAMAGADKNVSTNVKVIVRVRPPNDVETNGERKNVVEIMNENILVFDPKDEFSPFHRRYGKRRHRDIRRRRHKDLKFAFDRVFGWTSSNNEVFEHTTKTVLDGLLGGYNCSVFAYGATGAGKTHTMLGNESNPGVIYHTMIHLYRHIAEMSDEKTCDVAVSYLEVYNEQIRDLLMPRGTLPIREDHNSGVIIPGLSLHKPSSAEELLHMLQFGNKNRTQHPTDANAESSRSHAVFQVFIRQRDRTANISAQVKVAKMCLVDLAGSERATVTKNQGARLREGANINRSLLALGNVINSLADHKYKGHIPYRDSKLTRLLKDSLGGNCRTIMIAAVSPSELSYEDTYKTLKYADRAKNIRLNMKKNVLNVDFHVSRYGKIVEELRREITELKSKLQQCERPVLSPSQSLSLPSNLQSLRENLQASYNERRALRDQQLQQEISMRDTQWRLYRKHKCLRRASLLAHAHPESVQKMQGVIECLQRKVQSQEWERQALCQQLQDNTNTLHTLQSQAAVADSKASLYSQVLETSVQKLALEVEVNDCRHYIHHLRCLARAQEQEAVASDTLISALLQLVQRQHTELQGHGTLAPDIATGYQSVCEMVGQRGVSWADGEVEDDHNAFHINTIIDIPLVSSSGASLTRVQSPGHPVTGTRHSGQWMKNSAVTSCPGRVVNGQVVFSSNPASVASPIPPPAAQLTSTHHNGQLKASAFPPSAPYVTVSSSAHVTSNAPCVTVSSSACVTSNAPCATVSSPTRVTSNAPCTTTCATTSIAPCVTVSSAPCVTTSSTSCACPGPDRGSERSPAPSGQVVSMCADSTYNTNSHRHHLDSGDHDCKPIGGLTTTIHAGHTPNPRKLAHRTKRQGMDPEASACTSVSHCSSGNNPTVKDSKSSPRQSLNETFSVDNCVISMDSVNSTVVVNGSSLLHVPVVDNSLPHCGEKRENSRHSVSAHHTDSSGDRDSSDNHGVGVDKSLHSHHQHKQLNGSVLPSSIQYSQPGADDNHNTLHTHTTTTNALDTQDRSKGSAFSHHSDENEGPHDRTHSSVRRAINFDTAAASNSSTPMRVEGKSYADVVRTPTPPRAPLQTLNSNSPQLQAANLPPGQQQAPKSSGCASLYIAGPKALDNMRRLKQMGMPSLIENLVTGHKTGESEVNKPSYMQPTKATACRVRLQSSKDDSFCPKRVRRNNLGHSRSKTTSQLTKIGWKI